MLNRTPNGDVANSPLGKQDVNMRVPLQASAEGMKNTDETRCEIFGFVHFVEHTQNAITDSMKKAV